MHKKHRGGFLKFLSVFGLIFSVISLVATILYFWDAIANAIRNLVPNLPKINLFGGNCCGKGKDDDIPDEFDDFADV